MFVYEKKINHTMYYILSMLRNYYDYLLLKDKVYYSTIQDCVPGNHSDLSCNAGTCILISS
jgi:hypothetical protein